MAARVQPIKIGIDVSKDWLTIYYPNTDTLEEIDNTPAAIRRWLRGLNGPAEIGLEATNTYHLELLEQAHGAGHVLYLVDGYRVRNYAEAIGAGRAKTDPCDARLIARYIDREGSQLRRWSPPPAAYTTVQRLLRVRTTLVNARVAIEQSARVCPASLDDAVEAVTRQIEQVERRIRRAIRRAIEEAGWRADVQRCQAIEGIGELTAAALVMAFNRGRFSSADAFVAFLGLDVRVRDTGKRKGQRRLSKKGPPELRRLLYLAAMQASRHGGWAELYQRYQARGLKKIQALVALARKLARVAFALLRNGTEYRPRKACAGT